MSKISERLKYARIDHGYCLICGNHSKLSQDHVPPKCVFPPVEVEQRLITEFRNSNIKGVKANHGSVFKTICSQCNNGLGVHDAEIKRVTFELDRKIKDFLKNPFSVYNTVSASLNASSYLRGMVGHVLSAAPNTSCQIPRNDVPFYKQLCDFVLGNNSNITDTHTFNYWYYPHRMNITGALFSLLNTANTSVEATSVAACIYFYPVALLITEPHRVFNEIAPFARTLSPQDDRLVLDLSPQHFNFSVFPFFSLRDTAMLMHNSYVTVSHAPQNQKY
ncbi:hypothetical protein FXN80_14765 [Dickeya fangzhongdai]|uniref:hypothetical protein n=1 Tax=Dickeya fangzhongdai TaxID=1778540 RepID=UPI001369574D|nr:hypothetical protein [Dickeya fangzhongdai]UMB75375.1 hypothetical protein FXN80_14765 [Dickeya fangzhongdai]